MLRRKGKRQLNTMTSCQFHGCWTLSQAVLSAGPCNDLGSKSEWRRGCFVNLRPNVQFQRVYVSTSEKVKRNIIFMGLGFCFVLFIFWTSSKIYFVKLREKTHPLGKACGEDFETEMKTCENQRGSWGQTCKKQVRLEGFLPLKTWLILVGSRLCLFSLSPF